MGFSTRSFQGTLNPAVSLQLGSVGVIPFGVPPLPSGCKILEMTVHKI